jgi:hypothetical protein
VLPVPREFDLELCTLAKDSFIVTREVFDDRPGHGEDSFLDLHQRDLECPRKRSFSLVAKCYSEVGALCQNVHLMWFVRHGQACYAESSAAV